MPDRHAQPDLFAPPPAPAPLARKLRPPYSLAELTELDRQLREFDRIPDEWLAGWWEMYERAYDTILQLPKDGRAPFRAVFFEEAERLLQVEYAEERRAEAARAAAAKAPRRGKPRRQN